MKTLITIDQDRDKSRRVPNIITIGMNDVGRELTSRLMSRLAAMCIVLHRD